MIISDIYTEVLYFKVYEDYFNFPRIKTTPHNSSSSYCRKINSNSGKYFIEYDFYVCDDFTKEPFFVYRTKNSFTFVVETEEKDLIDLSVQKEKLRDKLFGFIIENSLGYHFENLEHLFFQHNSLDLITAHDFYTVK